mgnify:CR=1 FL=1|jgi:hypothetical protein|tara:strand:+ start:243 stop:1049 length:807 start_codon:yes stop_codon:yes gene_type:complete
MATAKTVTRAPKLALVKIGEMFVDKHVQATYRPQWAAQLAANFNVEGMGYPVLSWRPDGRYHIVDGQHRIGALRLVGFCDDDTVECEVYEGMSGPEEAELFLERNTKKAKTAYERFIIAYEAGRVPETLVTKVVTAEGMSIARHKTPGGIRCVTALLRIYEDQGEDILAQTIRIVRDAYGDAGFEGLVIQGVALVCERYGDGVDERRLVDRLSVIQGGVNGLMGLARQLRMATGNSAIRCIAAQAVETYNRGLKGNGRIDGWWKATAA